MSLETRILRYLKENPGANPRLIADALGVPVSQVRAALNKLRDSGHVVRVPGEGYYVRASTPAISENEERSLGSPSTGAAGIEATRGAELIMEIKSMVEQLSSRVDRLEKEVKEVKLVLEALTKASADSRVRAPVAREVGEDRLVREVKSRKVVKMSEALALAAKPMEEYVRSGAIKVVSDLVVDPEFYNSFVSRFPIRKLEIPNLSQEERELMNAMIREGVVYLHCGREYRVIQKQDH